jgi:tetratricopeptide (TPR) repeat protein
LQVEPDNVYANYWYAMLLSSIGKYDVALTHTQRAVESDPLSSVLMDRLAIAYLWMNDLPRAAEFFQAAADFGYEAVGENSKAYILYLIRAGEFSELRRVLESAGLPADWSNAWASALEDPALVPVAVEATHAAIARGQLPQMMQFGVWTLLDQADAAFDSFEYDLKTVDIEFLWAEEAAFLRESERFGVVLERLGIADTSS